MDNKGFSCRIRERRVQLGMSQTRLATAAGTTQQHISLIESGKVRPILPTLTKIMGTLGLNLTAQPDDVRMKSRLEGLQRFNAWEAGHAKALSWQEALSHAGAMTRLRAALCKTADTWAWQQKAAEWKRLRRLLAAVRV